LSVVGIDIGAGVVDSSYRGNIQVLVINNGQMDYTVEKGNRIAQLILERCSDADVQVIDTLSEAERGASGFGSTGK
jgi:dUTP pyrophosphatase